MKKTTKKALSVIIALVLMAAMSISAAAANATTGAGTKDIDVSAKYVDGVATETVYSVDVAWDSMEFTYTVSGTKVWNPAKHDYEVSTSDAWSTENNGITVVNHSNAAVKAEFSFAPVESYSSVSGTFSAASLSFPSAEGKALNAAELTGKTVLTLSGTLDKSVVDMTKVGTVTVTIKGE